jgi:hypothetical protein
LRLNCIQEEEVCRSGSRPSLPIVRVSLKLLDNIAWMIIISYVNGKIVGKSPVLLTLFIC